MIINDLVNAYDRLVIDDSCKINQNGFVFETIENLAIIDNDGNLKEIITIEPRIVKLPENLCPGGVKKNIIYDTFEFIFGIKADGDTFVTTIDGKSKSNKFVGFKNANLELLSGLQSDVAEAIVKFLENWEPDNNTSNEIFYIKNGEDASMPRDFKGKFAFCLNDISNLSYSDITIINKIKENIAIKDKDRINDGICCISGEYTKIAQKHKPFSGAKSFLISVDNDTKSLHSYGKTWCYDSPVSEEIVDKYTAVLNYFYRSGSKNKTSLGDDTLMFWANSDDDYQDDFLPLIAPTQSDGEIAEGIIKSAILQIKKGIKPDNFNTPPETEFFLLLLSQNVARFAVRRYYRTTFGILRDNILQHYIDMDIVGVSRQIPVKQVLNATVSSVTNGKVNPNFNGALAESILNNSIYPTEMLSCMVARMKTDHSAKDYQLTSRIAFIKAYLARKNRLNNLKEDITMSLNLENKDEAYLLGRLFAVMEKVQGDALGKLNSTIKDRYFASACSTPASVFPTLLIGYQNHVSNSRVEKYRGYYEGKTEEIMSKLQEKFPKQLDLEGQGRFIIGYYQQRTDLWTSKSSGNAENKSNSEEN